MSNVQSFDDSRKLINSEGLYSSPDFSQVIRA
jgi:hypothetical protein